LQKITTLGSSDIIRHEQGRYNRWQKKIKPPCPKNPQHNVLKEDYAEQKKTETQNNFIHTTQLAAINANSNQHIDNTSSSTISKDNQDNEHRLLLEDKSDIMDEFLQSYASFSLSNSLKCTVIDADNNKVERTDDFLNFLSISPRNSLTKQIGTSSTNKMAKIVTNSGITAVNGEDNNVESMDDFLNVLSFSPNASFTKQIGAPSNEVANIVTNHGNTTIEDGKNGKGYSIDEILKSFVSFSPSNSLTKQIGAPSRKRVKQTDDKCWQQYSQ